MKRTALALTFKLIKTWPLLLIIAAMMLSSLILFAYPYPVAQAQQSLAPALDWQKNYSGNGLSWVGQTSDGGYAYMNPNYSISKLDSNGNGQWNQTFADRLLDGSKLFVQTKDGGYAVTVHNHVDYVNNIDTRVLLLLKTDDQGITQWTKTLTALNSSYVFRSLIQTSDGGYALVGSFGDALGPYSEGSSTSNGSDFCLVKIGTDGSLQWTKAYGGYHDDDANSLVQTSDGGYALAGNTRSFGAGGTDAFIVKTDTAGNAEWARAYGGCGSTAVLQGQTDFLGRPIGDKQIPMPYPSGSLGDSANCIVRTKDGGLAFAGSTQWTSPSTYGLIWLVKTDANGYVQWNQTYANFESTPVYALKVRWDVNALIQADDGSFVMAGLSGSDNAYQQVSFIVKTTPAIEQPANSSQSSPLLPSGFHSDTIAAGYVEEHFPAVTVVVVSSAFAIALAAAGLLLYFKKRKR